MTGAVVSVTVESARVRSVLQALARQAGNLQPAFKAIGRGMVVSTQQRMEGQHGPDGKPWPGLSPATLIARAGGKRKAFKKDGKSLRKPAARIIAAARALLDSGQLRGSLTYRADQTGVEVGTNRVYAAIHQFGGQAGRGRKVTIPARPFLGVDQGDETLILSALTRHLEPGATP